MPGGTYSAQSQTLRPDVADSLLGRHDLHLLALTVQIVEPQSAESTDIVHATSETLGDSLKSLAGLDLAF